MDYGGIVGFFWGKDNFTRAQVAYSNERIMFYLDAPMLAYVDTEAGESVWSIGNSWPREVVSTLAHEFQHMIHYYQKDVLRDVTSSTVWLNEMCSMMAEDFVSPKLGVPGPRGVDVGVYSDGSAGAAANPEGFFPIFNYNDVTPVAYWPSSTADIDIQLASYAAVYAYGAYLGRNFGGAELFRAIVQNAWTGRAAVDQGLAGAGHGEETFGSTLVKWGIACLLSDDVAAAEGYRYNADGWMDASVDGIPYELGSVDLYNYDYEYAAGSVLTGPRIYDSLTFRSLTFGVTHAASSSWYYAAASAATGTLVWDIRLEQDTRLAVVVKP